MRNPATAGPFDELEQRLMRAAVAGDRAAWSDLVADDWTVIHLAGQMYTKADVLRDLFDTKERPMLDASIDEITVRELGVVAVVTGRTRVTARDGTRIALRFTDVFSKRNERWVVVASQATGITE